MEKAEAVFKLIPCIRRRQTFCLTSPSSWEGSVGEHVPHQRGDKGVANEEEVSSCIKCDIRELEGN